MRITLTNNFHNTSCNVIVSGNPDDIEYRLSARQANRIQRKLCGIAACKCGGVREEVWSLHDDRPHDHPRLINKQREHDALMGADVPMCPHCDADQSKAYDDGSPQRHTCTECGKRFDPCYLVWGYRNVDGSVRSWDACKLNG